MTNEHSREEIIQNKANLRAANLQAANLREANLREADLQAANLREADLQAANLREADLQWANLREADLQWANLRSADLQGANLRSADLQAADLQAANLREADLRWADLREANLQAANLRWADLRWANLSGVKGLLSSIDYLKKTFEQVSNGYIVFKQIEQYYSPPTYWKIEPGSILTENVHPDRTIDCACGVNVATLEWINNQHTPHIDIWKCLIKWEWLPGVVVPYHTDGKIRCERVQLLEIIKEE